MTITQSRHYKPPAALVEKFKELLNVYQPHLAKLGYERLQHSDLACTFSNRKGQNLRLEVERTRPVINCEFSSYDKQTEIASSYARTGDIPAIKSFLTKVWDKLK